MDPWQDFGVIALLTALIAAGRESIIYWQNRHKPSLEKQDAERKATLEALTGLRLDVQSLRAENRGLRTDLVAAQKGIAEYRESDATSLELLRQAREELSGARIEIGELRWLLVTLCEAIANGCDLNGRHPCPFTRSLPPEVRERVEKFANQQLEIHPPVKGEGS